MHMQVLLGVDRVDYIKGIPQKLLAFEALLHAHPELVGKAVLLQIAVPTRTEVPEYQRLRAVAHRLAGRINGKFGTPTYTPLHYLDKSIDFDEMVALYRLADVCVVTSLRDGMNLVSYEYVACQVGSPSPPASPPHLPCISPASRLHLARWAAPRRGCSCSPSSPAPRRRSARAAYGATRTTSRSSRRA